ncbi:MAG: glycosyltransferase [Planctomycetota bacterium]
MKILVVSHGFPPRGGWGTEFYTHSLVHGLAARGHAVSVLHPVRDGARPRYALDRVEEEGIPIFLLANPGDPKKRFAPSYADPRIEGLFAAFLSRERPDLVHFTYLLWGLSVRLPAVARAAGVASVVTLTDYGLLCHRGQLLDEQAARCSGPESPAKCARCVRTPGPWDGGGAERLARRLAGSAAAALGGLGRVPAARDLARREEVVRAALADVERFIAPTAVLGATFVQWGLPRDRVERLVYSFPEEEYAGVRSVPPPVRPRLGYLAQLAPHKGLDTLVAAAGLVAGRRGATGWEVVLHGAAEGGRHRRFAPGVLARADRRVIRAGHPFPPADAPRVLAGLSALVLPARWDENAPLSLLQARAAGVPVVASAVPGIAEIVEDGRHGRLVPPDDVPALARALEEVIDGRLGRIASPGLPLAFPAHLDTVERIHAAARAATAAGGRA